MRRLVIIESPYGNPDPTVVAANVRYAECALKDSLDRGEAPLASHLLYTRVLDDQQPTERKCGIDCGLAWMRQASLVAFYIDRGISPGMSAAQQQAFLFHIPIEIRRLEPEG